MNCCSQLDERLESTNLVIFRLSDEVDVLQYEVDTGDRAESTTWSSAFPEGVDQFTAGSRCSPAERNCPGSSIKGEVEAGVDRPVNHGAERPFFASRILRHVCHGGDSYAR